MTDDQKVSVFDVAKYILEHFSPNSLTSWKLQKLVYYCQAWSLVWDERRLFHEHFEAWADGPVCPVLFEKHRGKFDLFSADIEGNPDNLDELAKETVDAVIKFYGDKSGRFLSDLTHVEGPWLEARGDTPVGIRSHKEVTCDSMSEYYGGL
ncbi:MAG: DUF4065 domain-containing protein [Rhodobacteraceae bacterium]|nr:DUF4065 domain-containing protein [Paracoccaceae bacterium]